MDKEIIRTILADQKNALFTEPSGEIPRKIDARLHLDSPEVTVVTGVRRCGKSTLLRQIARQQKDNCDIHYINFEDQRLTRFTVDDFQSAYEEFLIHASSGKKQILIYDEIQLVAGWERWIAGMSSRHALKIWISGSNAKLLSSELATLLTGRYRLLPVTPISFAEVVAFSPEINLDVLQDYSTATKSAVRRLYNEYLQYGGFPRAFLSKDTTILGQYYEDIVEKDIALRRGVRNIGALKNLGSILASQNGRLFNQSAVARDIGIKSVLTISKFCDYFKETFLFTELRMFSRSRRRQLSGRSKFYAVDPLLAKQVGYHNADSLYWVLENHVCNELLRRGYEVYFWHSRKGYEVDFIARKKTGEVIAVQVAVDLSRSETIRRECRALESVNAELDIHDYLIITHDEPDPKTQEMIPYPIIPFFKWALA